MAQKPKSASLSIKWWVRFFFMSLLLAGCASLSPQPPSAQTPLATPTMAAFFQDPSAGPTSSQPGSPTQTQSQPTALAATATPVLAAPTRTADQITAISLYDDALNSDWSPEHSNKVKYNLVSKTFVHSGKAAIAVTPTDDFGSFFLTVAKNARKSYPRDRTLGVSFWLGSGAGTIATSDLVVTVTGSNQYTYWVANDTSVKSDVEVSVDNPLFSETRLYFLHVNRAIPPNSWVEVVVWLDDRIYDPDYTNVTGMYIKNDQGFLNTFYIDDVKLLVQK